MCHAERSEASPRLLHTIHRHSEADAIHRHCEAWNKPWQSHAQYVILSATKDLKACTTVHREQEVVPLPSFRGSIATVGISHIVCHPECNEGSQGLYYCPPRARSSTIISIQHTPHLPHCGNSFAKHRHIYAPIPHIIPLQRITTTEAQEHPATIRRRQTQHKTQRRHTPHDNARKSKRCSH